mmetsp:Transcript_10714/g.16802  ORF Transcript_10714/g.16802 Transcript_10714/m.16802 type:complete len:312 (-) Transcript_10714:69-1004(-)|eukprot:CAMPEP_0184290492 /NCGR_PEP_ID=MMETSP1049-20130417/2717_1 /TAXON_ID=77928 /ORGANISM="Proteomonas sulcata, Strain CCMP704" /LENGTH=311 /DNA_ID=CAMNT_0026597653 /DNA_START=622 /DNA_END=1557 /DNA_ORIENTATION=-
MTSLHMMLPAMEQAMRTEKAKALGMPIIGNRDPSVPGRVVQVSDYRDVQKSAGDRLSAPRKNTSPPHRDKNIPTPEISGTCTMKEEDELLSVLGEALDSEDACNDNTPSIPMFESGSDNGHNTTKKRTKGGSKRKRRSTSGAMKVDPDDCETKEVPLSVDKDPNDATDDQGVVERKRSRRSGPKDRATPPRRVKSRKLHLSDSEEPQKGEFGIELLKKSIDHIEKKLTAIQNCELKTTKKLERTKADLRKYNRLLRYKLALKKNEPTGVKDTENSASHSSQVTCAVHNETAHNISSSDDSDSDTDDDVGDK